MYKIIACDIDETLLNYESKVSKRNKEAIKKATELGVKFVLASGRSFLSCKNVLEEIDLYDKENEYLISFNGGVVLENKNNRIISETALSFSEANKLFKKGIEIGNLCPQVYTRDNVYYYDISQSEIDFLARKKLVYSILKEPSIDFLKDQVIEKILYTNENQEYLKEIYEKMKDLTEGLEYCFSSNRYIEFVKSGVNKGFGLRKLAEYLNVDIKDTIAIGDNNNDLSMIKEAGLGVGVANSSKDILEVADYITDADYNHDAVAEVIEKFILNN